MLYQIAICYCFNNFELVYTRSVHLTLLILSLMKTVVDQSAITHFGRAQKFPKTNISYSLISSCTCSYLGVRNVIFSENFAYVLNRWSPTPCSVSAWFSLISRQWLVLRPYCIWISFFLSPIVRPEVTGAE